MLYSHPIRKITTWSGLYTRCLRLFPVNKLDNRVDLSFRRVMQEDNKYWAHRLYAGQENLISDTSLSRRSSQVGEGGTPVSAPANIQERYPSLSLAERMADIAGTAVTSEVVANYSQAQNAGTLFGSTASTTVFF